MSVPVCPSASINHEEDLGCRQTSGDATIVVGPASNVVKIWVPETCDWITDKKKINYKINERITINSLHTRSFRRVHFSVLDTEELEMA